MGNKNFTGYVTKYALTRGVEKVELRLSDGDPDIAKDDFYHIFHGEGINWHRSEASAFDRAEVMRVKKIASLKKQIAGLKDTSFNMGVRK
ncbi:hypothetical protein KAR91_18095 [Candidatus Pacearchaeota archaeon]|nr:hypothetical protein [Candidatus Pacearchaeota archaeon]